MIFQLSGTKLMRSQNNYAVLLYTNLGMKDGMPLLLSAIWLTTAGTFERSATMLVLLTPYQV